MGTLIAAYVIVWLAIALYVARLGLQQRRLQARVEALQAQLEQSNTREHANSRAA